MAGKLSLKFRCIINTVVFCELGCRLKRRCSGHAVKRFQSKTVDDLPSAGATAAAKILVRGFHGVQTNFAMTAVFRYGAEGGLIGVVAAR